MFPDIQPFGSRLNRALSRAIEVRARELAPILNDINRAPMYEGKRTGMSRPKEENEVTPLHEASAELELTDDELATLNPAMMRNKLEGVADQMARQISEMLFKMLGDATAKTGNVVDAKGQPISFEVLMEALSALPVEFDEVSGEPTLSIVISPKQAERVKAMSEEYEQNPEQKRRHQELLAKKREEWRARSSRRRLVG